MLQEFQHRHPVEVQYVVHRKSRLPAEAGRRSNWASSVIFSGAIWGNQVEILKHARLAGAN